MKTTTRILTPAVVLGSAALGLAVLALTGCGNGTDGKDARQGATPQPQAVEPSDAQTDQQAGERGDEQAGEPAQAPGSTPAQPAQQAPKDGAAAQPGDPADAPAADQPEPLDELVITDLQPGQGETVKPGATVTIHYTGTFRRDGKAFDSSHDRGEPAQFPLSGVIPGFREGLLGMQVGGKRRIEIPWSQAYGEQGRPPVIPPKSDLVFEVELLDVQNAPPPKKPQLATEFAGPPIELGDGLVIREIKLGQSDQAVKPGATVVVHYTGVLADTGEQFDSSRDRGQPARFKLDPGSLIEGFVQGLIGMRAGGIRRLEIPAELAYGKQGSPPTIPPDADLVFEVELLSFTNPRELSTQWLGEQTRDDGLIVRIVKEGDPEKEPLPDGAIAVVHTLGVLEDGTVFDSTFDAGQPVDVPLEQAAIEGWRKGVVGMRPGEVRQFVVPPELGFGEEGSPPVIPPNATLTFEVELLDWRPPRTMSTEFLGEPTTLEEGITIREIELGEGEPAKQGQLAIVHYIAQLPDGTVVANTFDAGDMQVVPLDGSDPLPGLRKAIVGMKPGGIRRIELAPEQAFGQQGSPPVVPPNSPMVFEVQLVAVQ
ncbi:MAG: hypothetical protein KatS3mg103_0411 [Phycisphaerales bacterium]|nr:MAG: hypothetical protein KatS3mg103_0411 [Phycisphaerales bacterium]